MAGQPAQFTGARSDHVFQPGIFSFKQIVNSGPQSHLTLLKGEQAAVLQPYALTAQQRHFEMASQVARSKLTDYGNALQVELGRMLRDVEFSLDVNLCSSVGLDQWLAEPGVLLLDSTWPVVAIWAAHQREATLEGIDLNHGQHALVLRNDLDVEVFAIDRQGGIVGHAGALQ